MPIVLVTADDCHACVGFKQAYLDDLKVQTKKAGVKFIHVDLAKRMHLTTKDSSAKGATGFDAISTRYGVPMKFLNMVNYFPTLGQFTSDGSIYNLTGQIDNGMFVFKPTGSISDIVKTAIENEKSEPKKKSKSEPKTESRRRQVETPKASTEKIPDVQRRVMNDGTVVETPAADTPRMIYKMYGSTRSIVKFS